MCAALTLPPDLAPDERATVEAFREEAEERAALAVSVRRRYAQLRARGQRAEAALDVIAGDPAYPVTRATAARIVRRHGAWEA